MNFFEKIMEFEKKFVSKVISKDSYLKILAIIIALMLFITINGLSFLNISHKFEESVIIEKIPISVQADEDKIISGIPESMSVKVTGSKSELTAFSAIQGDLIANIDLTGKDNGNYELKASDIKYQTTSPVEIVPVVQTYQYTIDTRTKVSVPIEVSYLSGNSDSSVVVEDVVVSPAKATFEIGMKEKENIGNARVLLDLSEIDSSKSDSVFSLEKTVKLYDKNGEVMNTDDVKVKIEGSYTQNKVLLPVKYDVINNKSGKYISDICSTKANIVSSECKDEVEVYGEQSELEKLDYVTYTVDMSKYKNGDTKISAYPNLGTGVFIYSDGITNVEFSLEKGLSKEFEDIPIAVTNKSTSLEVPAKSGEYKVNVKVTGATSIINDMEASDILVYVDAQDIKKANSYTLPIQTNIHGNIDYTLSKSEVSIEFVDVKKES